MSTFKKNLTLQIITAVLLGVLMGCLFPDGQLKSVSEFGKIIIHWIKLMAGPFLFLTIVTSVLEIDMKLKQGLQVVLIALVNAAFAILIGIGLAHFFLSDIKIDLISTAEKVSSPEVNLSLSSWIKTLTPSSLFAPFIQNDILLIAFLDLFLGVAIRRYYFSKSESEKLIVVGRFLEEVKNVISILLEGLVKIIPLAVLVVVAGSVSSYGIGIFKNLFQYVIIIFLGFILQVFVVYSAWLFIFAKQNPKKFFSVAKAPLLYAFGVNSSLATLPLTLKALKDLKISPQATSLGAGVATNLNNDGIVLYEAMAVLFIMQIHGYPITETQMITVALSCMVAAMGITGIPEAGFISLSVVVTTMGLPTEMLPLLLSVDWVIARCRSVVNVYSDMTLSIALDKMSKSSSS